jgi:hypothetical protein
MGRRVRGRCKKHATNRIAVAGLAALLFAASSSFVAPAFAQAQEYSDRGDRFSTELAGLSDGFRRHTVKDQNLHVIVQFNQKPTQHHLQKMANLGGLHLRRLSVINASLFNLR